MEPVDDSSEPPIVQPITGGIRVASSAVSETKCPIKKTAIIILKMLALSSFTIFILCLPLGDPQEACVVEVCKKDSPPRALAYSYVCNIYRILFSAMKFTSKALQDVSETASCLLLETAHEAKIKFYRFLNVMDPQDLCRIVCCKDEMSQAMELTPLQKENQKFCKCKAKCCKKYHLTQTV